MYVLFLIEIYELLESFFGGFPHGITKPNYIDYENRLILKSDKCATLNMPKLVNYIIIN